MPINTTVTVPAYSAPTGFVPVRNEDGSIMFHEGPRAHEPHHGYRIEVSWTAGDESCAGPRPNKQTQLLEAFVFVFIEVNAHVLHETGLDLFKPVVQNTSHEV